MKYCDWAVPCAAAEIPPQLTRAGYTPLLSALLARRGICDPENAEQFLSGGQELLGDPMLLPDMDKAAARLLRAVQARETVAVFGDYDVDGITSCCLVTSWLREKGVPCSFYIPDRLEEGYGLSMAAMDILAARGATLIVTVDCGITAAAEADYAATLGIDMIITDHHECGSAELPRAVAVVDHKREGCRYPNRDLAGVGVAFKLLCAAEGEAESILASYADLVATGTVADVMPLTGENRYMVRRGLKMMTDTPRPGIKALLFEAGAGEKRLTAATIGFTLAPRLNAAGRLGRADVAVGLLMSRDAKESACLAAELCSLNRERQALECAIWDEARAMLADTAQDAPIILAAEGWHQGVVGIAASKLAEAYSLPAIMICLDGDMGKGSCRSYGDFNLFDALQSCSDCLEGFGGHALAAGLTIRRDRLSDFRRELKRYYSENPPSREARLLCDLRVEDTELLSMDCVRSLELLEPYGSGNPRPVICITGATLERIVPIGGGKHLRLTLTKGPRSFECVLFSRGVKDLGLREGDAADAAFYPQINEFRGRSSVQLLITDLRRADSSALCRELAEGREFLPSEAAEHCPEREDFIRVWRHLEKLGGSMGGTFVTVDDWCPPGICPPRLLLCLLVMEDSGLVKIRRGDDSLFAEAQHCEKKVELNDSALLQKLRLCRDMY
ncbi:MAG: single-stranded-DNA-specific exonuclease RecJ [Oscillospiraceae bacterium]